MGLLVRAFAKVELHAVELLGEQLVAGFVFAVEILLRSLFHQSCAAGHLVGADVVVVDEVRGSGNEYDDAVCTLDLDAVIVDGNLSAFGFHPGAVGEAYLAGHAFVVGSGCSQKQVLAFRVN